MRLTDKNMAMISRVIGTTANFISWDPRVFWEVVLFCLRPKCDYCVWKLTKHPFFTGSPCQSYSICKLLAVRVRQRSYPSSSYQSPEPGLARGAATPPPPAPGTVEPNTSSLLMDLFSLDSVILIMVTCNCLPFSYSRSIFRRHISWQVRSSIHTGPFCYTNMAA